MTGRSYFSGRLEFKYNVVRQSISLIIGNNDISRLIYHP